MKRKSSISIVAASLAACILAAPALATDPPNFDFYGFVVAPVPGGVGSAFVCRSVLTNNNVIPTPIPMDFDTKQHTLLVTGSEVSGTTTQQQFTAGVDIFSQDFVGGTLADYSNPGTFTDGELILHGEIAGTLVRNSIFSTYGNYVGKVNWTGGTRLGELGTATLGWPISGGWSRRVSGIPVGYAEAWDGKVEQPIPVAVKDQTWSNVKGLFR